MSGPKFRFTLVIGLLLVAWWAFEVINTYLLGERGLNFARYGHGVLIIGGAALCGFLLVWLTVQVAAWSRRSKTGFEAEMVDEYGTLFRMGEGNNYAISLSKFLPDQIAPPAWPGISPLETELLGFLNGYRHWPFELGQPHPSLYDEALARWEIMKTLPGTGPLHRAAALASVLGRVAAIQEVRIRYPLSQFWKRDRIRFERRCRDHGGLAAFVLSTLPGFRHLGSNSDENRRERRALTTALKFYDDLRGLPLNADPLAKELAGLLQRLISKRRGGTHAAPPGPVEEAALKQQIRNFLPTLVEEWQTDAVPTDTTEAVPLPGGRLLVRAESIITALGPKLPVELRERLNLWESVGSNTHPAWPMVLRGLEELRFATRWDDLTPLDALFRLGDRPFGPAVLLDFAAGGHPEISSKLARAATFEGGIDVALTAQASAPLLQERAATLQTELSERF
jgi:hypothetical protein